MALLEIIEEWDVDLRSGDPLGFPGYGARLRAMDRESVRTGRAQSAVVIEGDFSILGGSMGVVHGTKVVRAIDRAIELGLPVVVEVRTGGARMQEGMVSLIQMGRTAAAMGRLRAAGLGSVAVLHHPATGGVFASYASLCDVIAAETGATVGFAGPRVAEAITGVAVAGRSHSAETAREGALVDFVGDDAALRTWLDGALGLTPARLEIRPLERAAHDEGDDIVPDGAWGEVQAARRPGRPSGLDVAAALVSSWTELAGTDASVRAGLATIDGQRVVVIAQDRYAGNGRTAPGGFALARRAIALAQRRHLPIVTLIDTPGAEPGSDAEQAGVARSIAETFLDLVDVDVPTVGVCVGEGGSGGALALGVTDRLLIQQHAIFSVIGVEGAAAILHRDAGRAAEVADDLRLTSADLLELGIVDAVVPDDLAGTTVAVREALRSARPGDRLDRLERASAPWVRSADRGR